MLLLMTTLIGCNNSNNSDILKSSDSFSKSIEIDKGRNDITNHCLSCHNFKEKSGFVSPSFVELSRMDSIKRNLLFDHFLIDTTHSNIRISLSKDEIDRIRFYVNNQ